MVDLPINATVALYGCLAGIVFGFTAQRTQFCTMGAVSDAVLMGDFRRARMWMLAIAVALIGSQGLHLAGIIDLRASIYLTPNLGWLGAVIGGLGFGYGMVLAGGCGNRNLVRLGGGSLKSLVVVVTLAIAAMMTLRGLLALGRTRWIEAWNFDLRPLGFANQGLPQLLAPSGERSARIALTAAIVAAVMWFVMKDARLRAAPRLIIGGLVIGSLVPIGWLITGVLGRDDFTPTPLASFTFVAPLADGLLYLMVFTGASINFGIGAVGGVILGGFFGAITTGRFRLEGFSDGRDMARHLAGGLLMGVGGVLALGCTIGQGLTGVATLAVGSLIAIAGIVVGAVLALKAMEEGGLFKLMRRR